MSNRSKHGNIEELCLVCTTKRRSRYVVIIYARFSVFDSCHYCDTYFTLYRDSDSSTIAQYYAGIDNFSCSIIIFCNSLVFTFQYF